MSLTTPCDFAKARYLDLKLLLKQWNYLIFFLGVIVALFLAASILLFLRESWLPGALTTLGTLLTGGGATWLTNRRTEIRDEERMAFDELVQQCHNVEAVTDQAREAVRNLDWFRDLETAVTDSVITSQAARNFLTTLRQT